MILTIEDSLQDAVTCAEESLVQGKILLYPTDTVYGLGCDAANTEAVTRVQTIKERDTKKPFIVLAGSLKTVKKYFEINEMEYALNTMWPGPFTVLLRPIDTSFNYLKGTNGKIGVRVPKDPFLMLLLEQWRGLLISTSANLSGETYQHEWETLKSKFENKVDILIRRKNYPLQRPSAVIEWKNGSWHVLRKGPVPLPLKSRD